MCVLGVSQKMLYFYIILRDINKQSMHQFPPPPPSPYLYVCVVGIDYPTPVGCLLYTHLRHYGGLSPIGVHLTLYR